MRRSRNFVPINFPVRTLGGKGDAGNISKYKVFISPDDFKIVEAEFASEAIEKSEVKSVYKVVKLGFEKKSILRSEEISDPESNVDKQEESENIQAKNEETPLESEEENAQITGQETDS